MTTPLAVYSIYTAVSGCVTYINSTADTHAEIPSSIPYVNIPYIFIVFLIVLLFLSALLVYFLIRSQNEYKKMKQQIDEQEYELTLKAATLSTLYDSIPDLIFIKDMNFRYTECNKSFLRFFSQLSGDIIGKDDLQGFGFPDDKLNEIRNRDQMVISTARASKFEEYIPNLNGENVLFETVKAPLIVNGSIIGVIGVAHEITKYKKLEDEALTALCEKSIFITCLNSEVKVALNKIIQSAELAVRFDNTPETKEYLGEMLQSSQWLLSLINTIIDISKIETYKRVDDSNVSR